MIVSCDNFFHYPPSWQSKFIAFYQYSKTFNSDTFDYEELDKTDFVFMRWKEHFLVPDHTIKVESRQPTVSQLQMYVKMIKF